MTLRSPRLAAAPARGALSRVAGATDDPAAITAGAGLAVALVKTAPLPAP